MESLIQFRDSRPAGTPATYDQSVRALVQRVSRASVDVDGERISEIGPGLLVLLGITHDDG